MLSYLRKQLEKFRTYDRITKMSKIIRRYFVMNAFDGALTIFGVLIGSFLANVTDSVLVIKLGLATAVAVGVSGFSGAFFTEAAERKRELKEIEKAVHRKLNKTHLQEAFNFASTLTALVDGISPFLVSLFILTPFFFSFLFPTILEIYYLSFALSILSFLLLGMFLGHVSKENIILNGLKLVVVGFICMAIIIVIT